MMIQIITIVIKNNWIELWFCYNASVTIFYSLNREKRIRELLRVTQENQEILRRISQVRYRPTYGVSACVGMCVRACARAWVYTGDTTFEACLNSESNLKTRLDAEGSIVKLLSYWFYKGNIHRSITRRVSPYVGKIWDFNWEKFFIENSIAHRNYICKFQQIKLCISQSCTLQTDHFLLYS